MVDRIMSIIHGGSIKPNGDKDKAMRAVYEVVIGEGKAGKGNEAQLFLPLGPDMVTRVGVLRDHLQQGLDAFADTAKGVALEA
jgi:hypothetical protein